MLGTEQTRTGAAHKLVGDHHEACADGAAATVLGLSLLFVDATTVFAELQDSLDRIWRVPVRRHMSGRLVSGRSAVDVLLGPDLPDRGGIHMGLCQRLRVKKNSAPISEKLSYDHCLAMRVLGGNACA